MTTTTTSSNNLTKIQKLDLLKDHMQKNKKLPLRETANQLVFGDGDPDSEVYFLGEAPGFHEDKHGKPFVGLAGRLLNEMLESIGLKRANVYISNVVRFRPPNNRDPLPEELEAFAPYVDKEIEIIDPKIIVTLGRFSMNKFIPEVKISQVHGQARIINWKGKDRIVIPMYHPAAALRAGAVKKLLAEDFQKIKKYLKESTDKISETSTIEVKTADSKPKQLDLLS